MMEHNKGSGSSNPRSQLNQEEQVRELVASSGLPYGYERGNLYRAILALVEEAEVALLERLTKELQGDIRNPEYRPKEQDFNDGWNNHAWATLDVIEAELEKRVNKAK